MAYKKEIKCINCGEYFTPTKEEIKLHEEGFCDLPNKCDDCFKQREENLEDFSGLSDADSGL